ncbi:hypothetical protein ES707_11992 [subsurface metagenome]
MDRANSYNDELRIDNEHNYWEDRYSKGGTSGQGSVGTIRQWKWQTISEFCPCIDHVIDIGCGDLSFWEDKTCEDYIGIDISQTIVNHNRITHPKWNFIVSPADAYIDGLKKDCVLCLDVLFHLMDFKSFKAVLNNLCLYSSKYIFISTWINNPFRRKYLLSIAVSHFYKLHFKLGLLALKASLFTPYTDGYYQYFRPLETYFTVFKEYGFSLVGKRIYSDNVNSIYVFKRERCNLPDHLQPNKAGS